MAERALIFSAESIHGLQRALRGEPGGKYQTRRILSFANSSRSDLKSQKPQQEHKQVHEWKGKVIYDGEHRLWCWKEHLFENILLPIQRGDVVRVKETWHHSKLDIGDVRQEQWYSYRADGDEPTDNGGVRPWRSSMFMPRLASRYWLRIAGVRVERLQDITEADAQREGAMFHDGRPVGHHGWRFDFRDVYGTARDAYAATFDRINGRGSWAANPWVAVYEWEKVATSAEEAGRG